MANTYDISVNLDLYADNIDGHLQNVYLNRTTTEEQYILKTKLDNINTCETTVYVPFLEFDTEYNVQLNINGILHLNSNYSSTNISTNLLSLERSKDFSNSYWGVNQIVLSPTPSYATKIKDRVNTSSVSESELEIFGIAPGQISGNVITYYSNGTTSGYDVNNINYETDNKLDISTLNKNKNIDKSFDYWDVEPNLYKYFRDDPYSSTATYKSIGSVPILNSSNQSLSKVFCTLNNKNLVKSQMYRSYVSTYGYCTYEIYFLIYHVPFNSNAKISDKLITALYRGDELNKEFVGYSPYYNLETYMQEHKYNLTDPAQNSVGAFKLRLTLKSETWKFPNISNGKFFNIFGGYIKDEGASYLKFGKLPGNGGIVDACIFADPSAWKNCDGSNNIKFEIIENGTEINNNIKDISINTNTPKDFKFYIKEVSTSSSSRKYASLNLNANTDIGSERVWTYDNLTPNTKINIMLSILDEGGEKVDEVKTLKYQYIQDKAGNYIKVDSSVIELSTGSYTEDASFRISSNQKWELDKIKINYIFDGSLAYSTIDKNSTVISPGTIPTNVKTYIKKYLEYILDNCSDIKSGGTENTNTSTLIKLKLLGNTLLTKWNNSITLDFTFKTTSGSGAQVSASNKVIQPKAELKIYDESRNLITGSVSSPITKYIQNREYDSSGWTITNNGAKTFLCINKTYDGGSTPDNSIYLKIDNGNPWYSGFDNLEIIKPISNAEFKLHCPASINTNNKHKYLITLTTCSVKDTSIIDSDISDKTYYATVSSSFIVEQDTAEIKLISLNGQSSKQVNNDAQDVSLKVISSAKWKILANYYDGNWKSDSIREYTNRPATGSEGWELDRVPSLKKNTDITNPVTSTVKAVIDASNAVGESIFSITQTVAPKNPEFNILDSNGASIANGSTVTAMGADGGTFEFKIKNTGNIKDSYKITTSEGSRCKLEYYEFNNVETDSVCSNKATISTNDKSRNYIYTITVSSLNNGGSKNFFITQSDGTRQFNATISEQNYEKTGYTNGSITITNTGTISTKYRIYTDYVGQAYILFGSNKKEMIEIEPSINTPYNLSFIVNPNNTDEQKTCNIIIEDINNYYTINKFITKQDCYNKSIFYLDAKKSNDVSIYTSESVKGKTTIEFYINSLDPSKYMDSSVSINVQTSDGGVIRKFDRVSQETPSLPAHYGNFKKFKVDIANNPTDTQKEVYITVSAYYAGDPISSELYNYSNPYTVVFKIYQDPNAVPEIVGEDSGDYYKLFDTNYYYVLGPGIGNRTITVNDSNGYKCNWDCTKVNNKDFYNVSCNPIANTMNTTIKLSTSSITDISATNRSCNDYNDSSVKISVTNSGSGNSGPLKYIKVRRYPLPYFIASFNSIGSDVSLSKVLDASDFNGADTKDIKINLDVDSTLVNYEFKTLESNTTGNEFYVYKHRNNDGDPKDELIVVCPKNIDKNLNKSCKIIINYNYNDNIPDHTTDFQKELEITVNKINNPTFKIYDSSTKDEIIDDISYGYNDGKPLILDISINAYHNVYWDYSVVETGTSGNEFFISNISSQTDPNRLKINIPKNFSNTTQKTATITFAYQYNGNANPEQIQYKTIKLIVDTAPSLDIYLKDQSGETFNDSSYNYYDGKKDLSAGIDIIVSFTDGVDSKYITWNYSTTEQGTSGSEFTVINKDSNTLNSSIPTNPSLKDTKLCNIIFKYKYTEDAGQVEKTKTLKLTVNKAVAPTFKVYKK